MEPTIASAWIVAGSAVLGAVAGVGGAVVGATFSRRATHDSTEQTIEADKASRVWEKKSEAYTDALAGILHRMKVREWQRQGMMTETEPEQPSAPVDWPLVEVRLFAYATDKVLNALQQADDANSEWDTVFREWVTDAQTQADASPPPGIGLQAAQADNPPEAVEKAFPNASNMDHTLMIAIRNELKPGPGSAQPAQKRRRSVGERLSRITRRRTCRGSACRGSAPPCLAPLDPPEAQERLPEPVHAGGQGAGDRAP